jgi:type IV pilus assembly protein PilB
MSAKPIGQSMVEANLINQYQLNELLEYQKNAESRVPLGRLTVELGMVKDEEFAPFLASYFNVPYLNLEDCSVVQKDAIDSVPQFIARRLNILPLLKEEDTLTVAMSDPLDLPVVEDLETVTGFRIKRVVSPANRIRESIKSCYSGVYLRVKTVDIKEKAGCASAGRQKYRWPLAPSLIRLLIERAY